MNSVHNAGIVVTGGGSGIGAALARRFADDDRAVRVEAHHRRAQSAALRAEDALRLAGRRIHIRHQTVRRPQINA